MKLQRGKIVECFGFPASGKSSLCDALADGSGWQLAYLLSRTRWRHLTLPRRIGFLARLAYAEFGLLVAVAIAICRMGIWRSWHGIVLALFLPAQRRWMLDQRLQKEGNLIYDQGLLQFLWSALVSAKRPAPSARHLSRLLKELYKDLPVTIVYLDIESSEAAARIASRANGESRFDSLKQEVVQTEFLALRPLNEALTTAAQTVGLVVIRQDAALPLDQVASSVARVLHDR